MPLYDYHCVECDELFEAIKPVALRDGPVACPVCGSAGDVFLVMTGFASISTKTRWEPASDAERLFGMDGPAQSNNQFIVYALGQLNIARNWREVRQGCQDLHALVATHLPILPLWQVGETFAYRKEAIGIAKKPTGLYQDVQKWRFQVR